MNIKEIRSLVPAVATIISFVPLFAASSLQAQDKVQALDENGAPMFQVDPFWSGPLPNRWS